MIYAFSTLHRPYSVHAQTTQPLPFRVRIARDDKDLCRAAAVRALAYGRRVPGMDDMLSAPEPDDRRPDAVVLIAEAKDNGDVLGSLRMTTNLQQPLHMEHELTLPDVFRGRVLLEAGRLTVRSTPEARMVSSALYKALYEVSFHAGIDEVLVTARSPVDRIYRAMQFRDALDGRKIALPSVLNLPHGLYHLPVRDADALWRAAECPMYPFMAQTHHPDIEIDHDVVHRRFHASGEERLMVSGGQPESDHHAQPSLLANREADRVC
ncbi:MAG: hypothetical protein RI907_2553 [Pseudomonadota bacterium]|jgi:hypothetical protein